MDWTFSSRNIKTIDHQDGHSYQYTQKTFMVLVDSIIPRTPRLAKEYGGIQFFGALDFHTYEFLMVMFNNYLVGHSSTNHLSRYTMMGYYSEWYGYGYGYTRLETPNNRILKFHPLSWKQVGYPGPSLGYRALRS